MIIYNCRSKMCYFELNIENIINLNPDQVLSWNMYEKLKYSNASDRKEIHFIFRYSFQRKYAIL